MVNRVLIGFVVIALLLGVVKLYGNSRYSEGVQTEKDAVASAATKKRAEDAQVTIPKLRGAEHERQARTHEKLAKAAEVLPNSHCFNTPIDAAGVEWLRDGAAPAATGSRPTPD